MRISDWSSDVCSSDLLDVGGRALGAGLQLVGQRQRQPRLRVGGRFRAHGTRELDLDVADLGRSGFAPVDLGDGGDAVGFHVPLRSAQSTAVAQDWVSTAAEVSAAGRSAMAAPPGNTLPASSDNLTSGVSAR